jgi:hypothetical protein
MLRILDYTFLGFSIASILTLILFQLKGNRLNKKSLFIMLLPILALSICSAYEFDWLANSNNDLSRWLMDVDRIKVGGFNAQINYSDDYSVLWRVILWLVSLTSNYHWFPAISITVETLLYFYILVNVYEDKYLSLGDVVLCLIFKYSLVPLTMSATGFRGTVAFMIFCIGVYNYYKENKITARVLIPMVLGTLIHMEVMLGIITFLIAFFARDKKILNSLFILWPLILGAITKIFERLGGAYFTFILYKLDMYSPNRNSFDNTKVQTYIIPVLILTILVFHWYFKNSTEKSRNRVLYVITLLPVILGSYFSLNLIFLRLCYSLGFLFPILYGEVAVESEGRFLPKYNALIYLDGILLLLLTQGCWLVQSYGIFWKK